MIMEIKIEHIICFFVTAFVFKAVSDAQERTFDETRAFEYLEKQCEFGPRNPGSEGHAACRSYLISELKKFTPQVIRQDFTHYDEELKKSIVMSNIIASFPSSKDVSEWVMLCAHWETRPRADRDRNPENRNLPIFGANDGASGVAVLLEIANLISRYEPLYNVDIVLFDGEDYGREGDYDNYLLGSRYFVKHKKRDSYSFGILLDMIGDKNLRIPKENYSHEFLPELTDKIWKRARSLGIRQFVDRIGDEIFDDHHILIQAGIPVVDIIDFEYEPYWHTLRDTPDKCSPKSLKAVGDLLVAILYQGWN